MSNKSDFAEIIEDVDTNELQINTNTHIKPNTKKQNILQTYYDINPNIFEVGVDEVGRGPLFGRVYTAAVILSKDN